MGINAKPVKVSGIVVSSYQNEPLMGAVVEVAIDKDSRVLTIDAMSCQKEIAETVIERGADYILALKGNHSEMLDRVSGSFSYIKSSSVHVMEGRSHGRDESRICLVIMNLENIIDKDRWAALKCIVRIESRTKDTKTGAAHNETRY